METKSKNFIQDIFCCFKGKKKDKIENDQNSDGDRPSTINGRKNKPKIVYNEEEYLEKSIKARANWSRLRIHVKAMKHSYNWMK